MDKPFEWDPDKNRTLKALRKITFDQVVSAIKAKRVLFDGPHPNQSKYPHQQMLIVSILNYTYLVPYVEDSEKIFLKTIIPSRKANKKYNQTKEKNI
ncbi:MAG: BrnT family toxin [bacterium]